MSEHLSLRTLGDGQCGYVTKIEAEPTMRRRLLDMGLIPGTRVTCQGHSPAGDPAAYLIRGAVVALRAADAEGIMLEREPAHCPVLQALWA